MLITCFLWIYSGRLSAQEYPRRSNNYLRQKLTESKPDTNRVKILLALSRNYLFVTGATKTDIDSAFLLMHQALRLANDLKSSRSQGRALLVGALLMNHEGKSDVGLKNAQDALSIFTKINDVGNQAEAYIIIGQHYGTDGPDGDKKIAFYQKAAALFLKVGMKERAASAFLDIGDFKTATKSPGEALEALQHSLSINQSINYKEIQGLYDLMGVNYFRLGDYATAINYGLLAVKTALAVKDSSLQLCTIYGRLGLSYFSAKTYKEANLYYQKALAIAEKYHDKPSIRLITINTISAYYRLNDLQSALRSVQKLEKISKPGDDAEANIHIDYSYVKIYTSMKRFNLAEKYVNRLLSDGEKLNAASELRERVYRGVIFYYQNTNQFERSYPYIVKHGEFCRSNYLSFLINDDELWLFKADSALNKYNSAIRHYQRYKAVNDSLFDEKKTLQVAQLQIQYETAKKDRDIQLKAKDIQILNKKAQLQDARSEQDRVQRNIILIGTLLLALLVIAIYNRYRLKQRSNLLLEQQQSEINEQNHELIQLNCKQTTLIKEKEWLLREIHHRVKNNLQVTMSLLNIQSSVMKNSDALEAIQNSQRRMQAMALIHQKLYQSDNLALIDMSDYIPELVTYLKESFDDGNKIIFELLTPSIKLDIAQAVPLGLILNEAITNAIKYAFPNGGQGKISISIKEGPKTLFTMIVKDNGVGLPHNFNLKNHSSLGMTLMKGLTEQLQGDFEITADKGTIITVIFAGVIMMETEMNSEDPES
jgi:two-component sensor histidine kinase